jgi:hypothetical protein
VKTTERNTNKRKKPQPEGSVFLTPEEFAAKIQFHPESIRRSCRSGAIAAKKFGRAWRIPIAVAAALIESGMPAEVGA